MVRDYSCTLIFLLTPPQGDAENYNCECRVRAIIARENNVTIEEVGGRPWPATSTLTERWINDDEKHALEERMMID